MGIILLLGTFPYIAFAGLDILANKVFIRPLVLDIIAQWDNRDYALMEFLLSSI